MAKIQRGAEVAIQARVLVDTWLHGQPVQCDDVVTLPAGSAADLHAAGVIDTHADAVAYAISIGARQLDLTSTAPVEAVEQPDQP